MLPLAIAADGFDTCDIVTGTATIEGRHFPRSFDRLFDYRGSYEPRAAEHQQSHVSMMHPGRYGCRPHRQIDTIVRQLL
jgi:hypothetical protein